MNKKHTTKNKFYTFVFMQISARYTLADLTFSETAIRKGIDNMPDEQTIGNLKLLAENILEPLREQFGAELHINSCYRSPALNKAIGGAKKSQHTKGRAVDVTVKYLSADDLYKWAKQNLDADQIIQEFNSWVHISFSIVNRNQNLIATKVDGKTVYTTDTA